MRAPFLAFAVAALLLPACGKSKDEPVGSQADAGTFGAGDAATDATDAATNARDGGDEEPTPPTSDELIDQALEEGKIDEKTAAFYQLLAQMAPRRLPLEYQAAVAVRGAPSSMPARTVAAHLEEYGTVEAAAARAMLATPEEPEWMVFPAELPARGISDPPGCTENFQADIGGVRYLGSPIETKHFMIRALLPGMQDVPGQEQLQRRIEAGLNADVPGVGGQGTVKFRDYLDQVFEYYAGVLSMRNPTTVLSQPLARGGRIPIYVATCDGRNAAAEFPSGFIFTSVQVGFEDPEWRQIAIPHEMMHVFQDGYQAPKISNDFDWLYEATAVAVEDLVAPKIRRWSGVYANDKTLFPGGMPAMDRSFRCPEEPIHSSRKGPCQGRGGSRVARYRGDYSKFALIKLYWRQYGLKLAGLWGQFKDNGGDPRGIFSESLLARYQLALLGDVQGETPYFDPEDRAAFTFDPDVAPDFPPQRMNRYTYRTDVSRYDEAWRLTPSADSSMLTTEGLRRLDSAALGGVWPGGTHRLLIEFPPQISDREPSKPSDYAAEVRFKIEGSDKVAFNVVAVVAQDGRPSTTFDASSTWAETSSTVSELTSEVYWVDTDDTAPKYLLVLISNLGDTPAQYKGSVNLVQACLKACGERYQQHLTNIGCPEKWCASDCDTEYCQQVYQECLQTERTDAGKWALFGFCPFLCHPQTGTDAPLPADAKPGCTDWTSEVCEAAGAGDCQTMWSAFVPLPSWPQVECEDIKKGGEARCD
ncbi:MAG: hypothetical protein QM765_36815 [Myxococcales bacterium]